MRAHGQRVACLDGTMFSVMLPEKGTVQEAKRAVGQVPSLGSLTSFPRLI